MATLSMYHFPYMSVLAFRMLMNEVCMSLWLLFSQLCYLTYRFCLWVCEKGHAEFCREGYHRRQLEMWADAHRDGRPVGYWWHPL